MLGWSAVDEESLNMVIFNCEYMVEMMVPFCSEYTLVGERVGAITDSLVTLLMKVGNLEVRIDNYFIFI